MSLFQSRGGLVWPLVILWIGMVFYMVDRNGNRKLYQESYGRRLRYTVGAYTGPSPAKYQDMRVRIHHERWW